jgi:thiopurine S-methyltransferase
MNSEFWLDKWRKGEIGFHEGRPNASLQRHWSGLGLPAGGRVLVPLCGKSADLAWLAAQGHEVLGVELSEQAVEAFFAESGLKPAIDRLGAFRRYRAAGIEILCGDVFELDEAQVRGVAGFYDRAALIALPAPQRERYVELLARRLPEHVAGLLVTLEHDLDGYGPPFSVDGEEVRRLYSGFRVDCLGEQPGEFGKGLQHRGATRLIERAYRLQRP